MKITSLTLQNFKNYKSESFSFSDKINVICGENAQGKTNLLEAIFFISCVKPIHAKKEKDLISFNENFAKINAEATTSERNISVSIDISASPRKIFVNGIKQQKATEYIGNIQTVLFIPDDLSMIKEGPSLRRRFLNIAILTNRIRAVFCCFPFKILIIQQRVFDIILSDRTTILNPQTLFV